MIELGVFVAILIVAYVYIWRKERSSGGRAPAQAAGQRPAAREGGAQPERLLWPTKGPGVFEQEVENLEDALGLTTVAKAVAWAQSPPSGRTPSGWPVARSR